MSKPNLHSLAPYERVCSACQRVRSHLDFAPRRKMCNPCLDLRLMNLVPTGSEGKTARATKPEKGPLAATERYDGAELRPFEGRSGAMDAFSLPSLRFGERVYWRGADLASPPAAAASKRPQGR